VERAAKDSRIAHRNRMAQLDFADAMDEDNE